MQLAEKRDHQLKEARSSGTTHLLGAFFGVPISIKDHICEEGEQATCGSTWMAEHFVAREDAYVVKLMKREGAIPIVRGNLC